MKPKVLILKIDGKTIRKMRLRGRRTKDITFRKMDKKCCQQIWKPNNWLRRHGIPMKKRGLTK